MPSPILVQLVGIANAQLYHTIEYLDGTFQPFLGNVNQQESNDPGPLTDVTCSWGLNQDLHVFAINDPNTGPSPSPVWYTVRNSDGSWQPSFTNLQQQIPNMPQQIMSITSCPDVTASQIIHVCAGMNTPGGLWYGYYNLNTRTWTTEAVTTSSFGVGIPERIDSVVDSSGSLHVFFSAAGFVKDNVTAWHTSRSPQGQWQPGFDLIPSINIDSASVIYTLEAIRATLVNDPSLGIQLFGTTAIGELIVANPQVNPWNAPFTDQTTTGLTGTVFTDVAGTYLDAVTIPPSTVFRMCAVANGGQPGQLWYDNTTVDPLAFFPLADYVSMPPYPFSKIAIAGFHQ
ncbi:MAG TPA: hypothetical protein VFT66_07370 [Roseiflexaceae bacterium]|jgi:hypothetical protein|nr:hypothetical protein [Roseiflexaceae bacterium]